MKKLLLALFLVFTLPLSAEEQPAVPTADEQAAALINAQEWFRLEACYPEIRDELSPFVRLLCEASLGSHFNRLPDRARKRGLRPWRPNGGSKPWPDIRARRSRNPTAKSGCR